MKRLLIILLITITNVSYGQWVEQNSGTTEDLYSISAVNDSVVWVIGDNGTVLKSLNGGTVWQQKSFDGFMSRHIFAVDEFHAFAVDSYFNNTYIMRTSNGGNNWSEVFRQSLGYLNSIHMFSELSGICVADPRGGRWSIFKTYNGGLNWDSTGLYIQAENGETGYENSFFVSGDSIWFGSNKNKIYFSSNAGQSFSTQSVPATSIYSIWFNSSTEGLSGSNSTILSTSNSGTNWISHGGVPGAGLVTGITGRSQTYWFTRASSLQIYKTTNNGATFVVDYNAPLNQGTHFNHISKARNGNRLWAVRDGGYISTNDGSVGISNISSQIPNGFTLSQNYPNPFNPTTNINFDVPKSGFVKLTVYDITGKEVKTLVNENMQPGSYRADFDGGNLSSGVYYYTLQAGDFVQTKKMILVK